MTTRSTAPLLTDGTITLRAPEPADLDRLYVWENDTTLWSVGRAIAPYSRQQLAEYIASYDADIHSAGQLRLMIQGPGGEAIGAVDLYDYDPVNHRAGVGILVDAAMQGRGMGGRALRLLGRYCSERLAMHQLWAVVPVDNAPCRALFDAAGYTTCGRMRSWVRHGRSYTDALLLQLLFA